jgi:HK97 family phage major capsid protein
MARGEIRSHTFERRALSTNVADKGPETVPQSFYDVIQEQLATLSPMLDASVVTLLTTASGEDIKVPVQTSRSAATTTAAAAVFGESYPQ